MKHLILILLLSSCSASNLMQRAIKKDPNIVKTDTVIVDRIIEGQSGIIAGLDSVIIDNERIYIKAIANGKIDLKYNVKDLHIQDTTEITNVVIPPSNSAIRQAERTKRKIAKQDGRTNRVTVRNNSDVAKKQISADTKSVIKLAKIESNRWRWFCFWFVSCLGLMILIIILRWRFKVMFSKYFN